MRGVKVPHQRINLYVENRRDDLDAPLQPRTFAWVAGVGLVAVLLGYLAMQWELTGLQQELTEIQAQNQARRTQIEQLRAGIPPQEIDPALQAQLAALLETRNGLQKSLGLVRKEQQVGAKGFSEVFRGFARRPVQGLWLQDVQLVSAGDQFMLRGQARDPALVPRLLKTLRDEPAFSGRSFSQVRMLRSNDEEQSAITFELRSRVEADDAG